MHLGPFSLSLAVEDIQSSRKFYETLGFTFYDGNQDENWLILRNGDTTIGLFQGMFERNMLTFHPQDVRAIQRHLKENGIPLIQEADGSGEGAAHITLLDPDGNPILFDQIPEGYTPQSPDGG